VAKAGRRRQADKASRGRGALLRGLGRAGALVWAGRKPFGKAVAILTAAVSAVVSIAGIVAQSTKVSVPATILLLVVMVAILCVAVETTAERDEALRNGLGRAGVAQQIHDALHRLRYCAQWRLAGSEEAEYVEQGKVVNDIAAVFTALTGKECRACFKWLWYKGNEDEVSNWSDPSVMEKLRVETGQRSGTTPFTESKDCELPISACTAFEALWLRSTGKRWFLVNDIEKAYKEQWYKNPTRPAGTPSPAYNASLVWPIQMDPRQIGKAAHIVVKGFLAVDTKATNVFTEAHAWVGAGLADAFFTALDVGGDAADPPSTSGTRHQRAVRGKPDQTEVGAG